MALIKSITKRFRKQSRIYLYYIPKGATFARIQLQYGSFRVTVGKQRPTDRIGLLIDNDLERFVPVKGHTILRLYQLSQEGTVSVKFEYFDEPPIYGASGE